MDQLAQYYNEQFKQPLDPPFETLTEAEVIRLEKAVKHSAGYAIFRFIEARKQLGLAFEEAFQKIGILKS